MVSRKLKVARDVASEEDRAQVTETLPFHAGNNAKYLKDCQQKATEAEQQNHFGCCVMTGQIEERQTGRKIVVEHCYSCHGKK